LRPSNTSRNESLDSDLQKEANIVRRLADDGRVDASVSTGQHVGDILENRTVGVSPFL
jgi:hypothetical protein